MSNAPSFLCVIPLLRLSTIEFSVSAGFVRRQIAPKSFLVQTSKSPFKSTGKRLLTTTRATNSRPKSTFRMKEKLKDNDSSRKASSSKSNSLTRESRNGEISTIPANLLLDEVSPSQISKGAQKIAVMEISVESTLGSSKVSFPTLTREKSASKSSTSTSTASPPEQENEPPYSNQRLHNIVHFNNAGASPQPTSVLEAVTSHLIDEATLGGYLAEKVHRTKVDQVYVSIARLLGKKDATVEDAKDEVALVESATVGWTRFFYAAAEQCINPERGRDVIVCCEAEYAANLVAMEKFARERNATVVSIPSIANTGIIDLKAFQQQLQDLEQRICMVCITHIPTNSGIVNPVDDVGAMIAESNKKRNRLSFSSKDSNGDLPIIYLVDACQSVGQRDINVDRMHCHCLTASGRKYLRGPRGTGFLYVKKDVAQWLVPSHVDHHAAPVMWVPVSENGEKEVSPMDVSFGFQKGARRFEFWESSIANSLGLGAAVDHCLAMQDEAKRQGQGSLQDCISVLGCSLQDGLRKIPHVVVHHDYQSRMGQAYDAYCDDPALSQCGIVTFYVRHNEEISGLEANSLVHTMLVRGGFALSVVPATSTPMDSARSFGGGKDCVNMARASVSYFNTMAERDKFCSLLASVIAEEEETLEKS